MTPGIKKKRDAKAKNTGVRLPKKDGCLEGKGEETDVAMTSG